jgi:hypothetical protein
MFDPRFNSLKVVENYVGRGVCIHLVIEYDVNAIIPFLIIVFEVLNHTVQACAIQVVGCIAGFGDCIEEDNNIFSVGASMEESSRALVGELFLSRRLYVSPITCVDPLVWHGCEGVENCIVVFVILVFEVYELRRLFCPTLATRYFGSLVGSDCFSLKRMFH